MPKLLPLDVEVAGSLPITPNSPHGIASELLSTYFRTRQLIQHAQKFNMTKIKRASFGFLIAATRN